MYKFFYNMDKDPFENYPLTSMFYNSRVHHDAWNYLAKGIKKKEPVLFVTGEYGTGKTLLCLKLVKVFIDKKTIPFVFIPTPNYSFSMILKKIAIVLGISGDIVKKSSDESALLSIIYEYFEKIDDTNGKFVYIIIDEAQDMSYSFANKLKLLTSFNCNEHFPFKIIIFGHMNFLDNLEQRDLQSLRQRIKKISYLKPFDFHETKEYIYFRLIYSGAAGNPVFDDDALRIIQSASSGIPRLINNICDTCLVEACSRKISQIGPELVRDVIIQNMNLGQVDLDDNDMGIDTQYAPDPEPEIESSVYKNMNYSNAAEPGMDQASFVDPYDSVENGPANINMGNNIMENEIPANQVESEFHFVPVSDEKDMEDKEPVKQRKKKLFDKKAGLILILTLIVVILSYILFLQIRSTSVSESNKKIGSNFMSNQTNAICYENIIDYNLNNISTRYLRYNIYELHEGS